MKRNIRYAGAVLAVLAAGTLSGSAFAVFQDSESPNVAQVSGGTVSLAEDELIITKNTASSTAFPEDRYPTGQEHADVLNVNPGDRQNIDLIIKNTGNKSVMTETSLYVISNDSDLTLLSHFHLFQKNEKDLLYKDQKSGGSNPKDYDTTREWMDITKGTIIASNQGISTGEKRTWVHMEAGEYKLNGTWRPARKYTFRHALDGYEKAEGVTEKESGVQYSENFGTQDLVYRYTDTGTQKTIPACAYVYRLQMGIDSEAPYTTMEKGLTFKTHTRAVQYRSSSDKNLNSVADDKNDKNDSAFWKSLPVA